MFPRLEREDDDDGEEPAGDGAANEGEAEEARGKGVAPVERRSGGQGGAPNAKPEITIDEFARLDLRLATVLEAGPVPGTDKLMKLQLDVGGERRQVVAGIQGHYEPAELVGRQVVVVANLRPARLRGEISQGMVLAAEGADGSLALLAPDRPLPPGSTVR